MEIPEGSETPGFEELRRDAERSEVPRFEELIRTPK